MGARPGTRSPVLGQLVEGPAPSKGSCQPPPAPASSPVGFRGASDGGPLSRQDGPQKGPRVPSSCGISWGIRSDRLRGILTLRPLPQPHVLRGILLEIQSLPQPGDHRGDPDPLPLPQLDGLGAVRNAEGSRPPAASLPAGIGEIPVRGSRYRGSCYRGSWYRGSRGDADPAPFPPRGGPGVPAGVRPPLTASPAGARSRSSRSSRSHQPPQSVPVPRK